MSSANSAPVFSTTIDALVSLGLLFKPQDSKVPFLVHNEIPDREKLLDQTTRFAGPVIKPKKQPPMFWKAFGFALKRNFTISGSLYDDGRALFLAELGEVGIPINKPWPVEVTNYEVFVMADAMQRLNKPVFSLGGGSFFEFLNSYLRHAGSDKNESEELRAARTALENAKIAKDQFWQDAVDRYNAMTIDTRLDGNKPQTLVEFLGSDKQYKDAWEVEQNAAKALYKIMTPDMASLSKQIDLLRLADMRLESQVGNNMRVSPQSEDWVTLANRNPSSTPVADEKFIYFQPWYSLPNYAMDAKAWIDATNTRSFVRDGPYEIPLAGIWDRKWSDLGHPALDNAAPMEKLTSQQKDLLSTLTVNLTFLQKPAAYQVRPGAWDVRNPRVYPLLKNAPEYLSQQVCRTSKMIFAWGLEVEIILPNVTSSSGSSIGSGVDQLSVKALRNLTLSALDLPLKQGPDGDRNSLIFQSVAQPTPLLLGVLADII